MAILDWFKKKQDRARKEGGIRAGQKTKIMAGAEDKVSAQESFSRQPLSISERVAVHAVLRGAHITEKSTRAQQDNKYIFDIFPFVESPTIKQAVESIYKVHVRNVHIVKVPPQKRRRGRFVSTHARPNKAIVTLRKGDTIDVAA